MNLVGAGIFVLLVATPDGMPRMVATLAFIFAYAAVNQQIVRRFPEEHG